MVGTTIGLYGQKGQAWKTKKKTLQLQISNRRHLEFVLLIHASHLVSTLGTIIGT